MNRTILFLLTMLTFATTPLQAGVSKLKSKACATCINPEVTDTSTVYLFSHGLDPRPNTGIRQAREYVKNGIISGVCYTFNYNDSMFNVNFGQEDDCSRLAKAYEYVTNVHPNSTIILVGLSRGSVAVLHFLASYQTEKLSPIKAVLLESPFDTLEHVLEHIAQKYCWFLPEGSVLLKKLVRALPNYKSFGLPPIAYAKQISINVPFLISYSLQDKVIPAQGTQTIIATLVENNNRVTVVELEKGKHSTASFQEKFQDAAHTFFISNCLKIN